MFDEQLDSDFDQISKCLLSHHFSRVPIVYNGKFIGVMSRKDLIWFFVFDKKQ